ncbi:MAG: hypothetical protein NTZ35_20615 [Ignavibacteriales bacterium]|nr:hypothetical protein [Ignavibacteriales bacterium]
MRVTLSTKTRKQIDDAVAAYEARYDVFLNFSARVGDDFRQNAEFMQLVHSIRVRAKAPTHLRDKLNRRALDAAEGGEAFDIDKSNVFQCVSDLAGVRVLHIHTTELKEIYPKLKEVLAYHEHAIVESIAYTWDTENTKVFKGLGIPTEEKPSLYTSVHFVIRPHHDDIRCEIQVRTLAEELWGEVSHEINYPHQTNSIACTEQLLALARFTSGCTRLVDSLFASQEEHAKFEKRIGDLRKRRNGVRNRF